MPSVSYQTLALYALAHAAVDAACATLALSQPGTTTLHVLLYNLLAFGLQPLLAPAIDERRCYRQAAVLGCILTGLAFPLAGRLALPALCLAALGNALLHLGGGAVSLLLKPGSAMPPGLFVAPGGIGLMLGTMVAGNGSGSPAIWGFGLALLALALLLLNSRAPASRPSLAVTGAHRATLFLLLAAIALRSFAGLALVAGCQGSTRTVCLLALAASLGKAAGGWLADRVGWLAAGVGAPLLALLLLPWHSHADLEAVLALGLLSVSMPVTLAAVGRTHPQEPSFSFGLTALALLCGGLPSFSPSSTAIAGRLPIFAATGLCAACVYLGLRLSGSEAQPQTQDVKQQHSEAE